MTEPEWRLVPVPCSKRDILFHPRLNWKDWVTRNGYRWPRWLARAYAERLGYFWGICPWCGRECGGQEWNESVPVPGGWICLNCADKAEGMNRRTTYICERCVQDYKRGSPTLVAAVAEARKIESEEKDARPV